MTETKTNQEILDYKQTKSGFSDYPRFEDDNIALREAAKRAFISNSEWFPSYEYPKNTEFDQETADLKRSIYEAVLELEAAKKTPGVNEAELELYAGFHEARLKRIMLVEAARSLKHSISGADSEVSRRAFLEINEAAYGEFNTPRFLGMLDGERNFTNEFQPANDRAIDIKSKLTTFFEKIDTGDNHETALISGENLTKLHDFVVERYSAVLDVVPDTSDDVYYDAEQCAAIIDNALVAGNLDSWKCEVNPSKSNPSTNQIKRIIFLPTNTRRNASELRRLIIHEQEVHARRAENAKKYDIKPIELGTADYADVEEGLGIIMECSLAGDMNNPSFDRARDRYLTAGLALGADGYPRDAREVYEILWRVIALRKAEAGNISLEAVDKSKDDAYKHIENAYRGTQFWMKGIIYTKLKVYYEGLAKNADYISENIDNLDDVFEDMMVGKYNHTDSTERNLVLSVIANKKGEK